MTYRLVRSEGRQKPHVLHEGLTLAEAKRLLGTARSEFRATPAVLRIEAEDADAALFDRLFGNGDFE